MIDLEERDIPACWRCPACDISLPRSERCHFCGRCIQCCPGHLDPGDDSAKFDNAEDAAFAEWARARARAEEREWEANL